ncbi:DUF4124 domain-containing protein [Thalassotalea piscium]
MNKALLLLISTLTCMTTLHAQVYKIVDANGNVTFSQIEPIVGDDEKVQIESVDISVGNSGMSSVSSNSGYEYCGDIQLPSKNSSRSSKNYFVRDVQRSKENWKNSLKRLSENVERTSKYNVQYNNNDRISNSYKSRVNTQHRKEVERNNERMRDLRCAVNWANSQSGTLQELHSTQQSEKQRLLDVRAKLEASITKNCGLEPIYDPSESDNKYKIRQWSSCSKSKRKDIQKIDSKVRRL